MASSKKLPECDVLAAHISSGMTNRNIAEQYGTTSEAVRQALIKCGIRTERLRPSHALYLPWRIRADHVSDVLARRLRAYSKRQQNKELTPAEARLLDEWIVFMEGGNPHGIPLSVHYDRTDEQGFWLEPRKPGDRDYISPPLAS